MQAQRERKCKDGDGDADGDSAEDDSPTREKPPRPPNRRKRSKEPTFEEDIVDGFAILAFRTYEDLEVITFPRSRGISWARRPPWPMPSTMATS